VPFDIPMAWNSGPRVDKSQLLPGDVLFFSNTVFAGLSHVAIYIGNDQMIAADNYAVGVVVDQLNDPYWASHYTGATRPLALVGTAPQPGAAATPAPPPVDQAAAVTTTVMASAPAGSWLKPIGGVVRLYSGPGNEYSQIGNIMPGSTVYEVSGQGHWYDVRTPNNTYGWVSAGSVAPVKAGHAQATSTLAAVDGLANASAVAGVRVGSVLYVVTGPLKVRSGPGKSYNSIGFVKLGARLTVYQLTPDWARVATPSGQVGWVALQYVATTYFAKASDTTKAAAPAVGKPPATVAKVTSPALNVRSLPDSHARVVTVLFAGETVQVIGQRSGWDEIKLRDGATGWVSVRYLIGT
jgi:uncharacterized protein YgiM (DUF1202 family)